ncbi:MAG: hypothetical protein CBARDCOR_2806 [uncultured Caballeronia sp.]|nr:MAG: hypothetical protein CBARDCOR_2806 [uncultured Caballeronia sp.]
MSLAGAGAAMADDTDVQETNPTVAIADGAATVAELNASGVFTALSQPHMLGAQLLCDAAPTDPVVTGSPYLAQGKITAVGANNSAVVAGADSLAVGAYAYANDMSVAIGTRALAGAGPTAVFAIAIGYQASATASQSVALGVGASASGYNSVALGQGAVADVSNIVSVGKVGGEHKIVNVAAGTTTDAVNGWQLTAAGLAIGTSGAITNAFVAYATRRARIPSRWLVRTARRSTRSSPVRPPRMQ